MPHGKDGTQQLAQLKPVLGEILRTCVHPQLVLLQIEHIADETTENDGQFDLEQAFQQDFQRTQNLRLFLTDGELLVQALLHRRILDNLPIDKLRAYNIIKLYDFDVKKAKRKNGLGNVVYLAIKSCEVYQKGDSWQRESSLREDEHAATIEAASKNKIADHEDDAGGFIRDEVVTPLVHSGQMVPQLHAEVLSSNVGKNGSLSHVSNAADAQPRVMQLQTPSRNHRLKRKRADTPLSDEDDVFETISVDLDKIEKRRQSLLITDRQRGYINHKSSIESIPSAQPQPKQERRTPKRHVTFNLEPLSDEDDGETGATSDLTNAPLRAGSSLAKVPLESEKSVAVHSPQPPLHSLATLIHPPLGHSLPRKSYVLSTFAVITHVGATLISRPGSPFPPKRHIKIDDPSMHRSKYGNNLRLNTKGVTVAVYRDARNFKPAVGTVALFRGLVMQRLPNHDIILNVYPISTSSKTSKSKGSTYQRTDQQRHTNHKDNASNNKRRVRDTSKNQHDAVALASDGDLVSDDLFEQRPQTILDDGDWFITSPALLTELGHDVQAMQAWWKNMAESSARTSR